MKRSSFDDEKHFRARKRKAPTPKDGAVALREHIFFHPDFDAVKRWEHRLTSLNRRLWHRTRSADPTMQAWQALAGFIDRPLKASQFTAGGESHPALKTCAGPSTGAKILRPCPSQFGSQGRHLKLPT